MASKLGNDRIDALRGRQRRERNAVMAVAAAQAAIEVAAAHRADVLVKLDAAVVKSEHGLDVALAVLASLMPDDATAEIVGVEVAAVRAARKRVGAAELSHAVARLDGAPRAVRVRAPRPAVGDVADGSSAGRFGLDRL
jgi:hypothetical protein